MRKDYIKTEAKVYLDGKEITNFFTDEVQVIAFDEANNSEVLKRYDAFEGTITLTGKQAKRFIKVMVRAERQRKLQQLKAKLKLIFQKLLRICSRLKKDLEQESENDIRCKQNNI